MLALFVNALVSAGVVGLTLARTGTPASTVPIVLVGVASVTLSIWGVLSARARGLLLVTGIAFGVLTFAFSPDLATEAVLSLAASASFVAGISSTTRRAPITQ